ncbi:MAG: hypothetical protein U1C49_01300 [Candidatus Andersenbacteria bacterium]|nr:hypothetical protein [bacterium]MDZ4225462.1 hypothetical protein [Candidatus Andersenbacteria bacterium]
MPGKNKQYRRLGFMAIVVILLIAAQPFLWKMVSAKALELADMRSQGQQIVNVKERNTQMSQVIDQQRDYDNQLKVVIPGSNSLTQIVERLEQVADQYGLTLDIKSINEIDAEKSDKGALKNTGITKVTVSLIAGGNVDRLLDFLESIEHIQELAAISSWSLKAQAHQGEGARVSLFNYSMSVDIIFYVQKTQ